MQYQEDFSLHPIDHQIHLSQFKHTQWNINLMN